MLHAKDEYRTHSYAIIAPYTNTTFQPFHAIYLHAFHLTFSNDEDKQIAFRQLMNCIIAHGKVLRNEGGYHIIYRHI